MPSRAALWGLAGILTAIWCVGMFARGYWTPDEPREADIAWRMSFQDDKAVPLLAGEAFCEKPPLTYWVAGSAIRLFGTDGWAARLPNFLYALISALSIGLLAARALSRAAGIVAAAALSSFLLSYQVAIWLATDAPLLAFVSAALLGLYLGFYAEATRERLQGYCLMHLALALAFLSKNAAGWMVPLLALAVLIAWERRWRELLRWELYAGVLLEALLIGSWIGSVYAGPEGLAHLKTFFWNNLVGRFAKVDAPPELQYATGHRNSPGKYLRELPMYLYPWTLLVIAALWRLWRTRGLNGLKSRAVRFSLAVFLPSFILLSFAATARNVYLAPALPGLALLIAWWSEQVARQSGRMDVFALRATALILLLSAAVLCAAAIVTGQEAWEGLPSRALFVILVGGGLLAAAYFSVLGWAGARRPARAQQALFLAYAALLIAPLSQIYAVADTWQDLPQLARAIEDDSTGRALMLMGPDETTRAIIDMFARTDVTVISEPLNATAIGAAQENARETGALALAQLPGRTPPANTALAQRLHVAPPLDPPWLDGSRFVVLRRYQLPNGRRYALLAAAPD